MKKGGRYVLKRSALRLNMMIAALAAAYGIATPLPVIAAQVSPPITITDASVYPPTLAVSANGNFAVGWLAPSGSPLDWPPGVAFVNAYQANGTPIGSAPLQLASNSPSSPTVAMDPNGEFVAAWIDQQPTTSTSGYQNTPGTLYVQRYSAAGTANGNKLRVSSTKGYAGGYYVNSTNMPQVAMDDAGDFAVAWSNNNNFSVCGPKNNHCALFFDWGRTYAASYRADGSVIRGKTVVDKGALTLVSLPAGLLNLFMQSNGDISFTSYTGTKTPVWLQAYTPQLVQKGKKVALGNLAPSAVIGSAADAAGNVAVLWTDGSSVCAVSRFDTQGQPLGNAVTVAAGSNGDCGNYVAALAVAPSGDFAVVWRALSSDGGSESIVGRFYNADGTPSGAQFTVVPNGVSISAVSAGSDAQGNLVVAWKLGINTGSVFASTVSRE
jgi:hypothetical protein